MTWDVGMSGCFVKIKSEEAPWSSGVDYESGNMGHRAPVKGGYFPVPPTDTLNDIRNAMVLALEQQGVECEVHTNGEVGAMGQNEIGTRFAPLVQRADWMQSSSTRCGTPPRPTARRRPSCRSFVVGDNGSGMHCHQSIWKGGKNLFAGNGYAGLSDLALHYIGGIIKHAKALQRHHQPGHELVQAPGAGFEAPIASPTRRATALPRAASRTYRAPTAAAWRCFPTRPPMLISRSRRC